MKKRGRGASRLWTTWWLHPTGDALLMGLSRGLVVCGVTEEWTTQDLMNAVEADHQGLGLLSLPPGQREKPRRVTAAPDQTRHHRQNTARREAHTESARV